MAINIVFEVLGSKQHALEVIVSVENSGQMAVTPCMVRGLTYEASWLAFMRIERITFGYTPRLREDQP